MFVLNNMFEMDNILYFITLSNPGRIRSIYLFTFTFTTKDKWHFSIIAKKVGKRFDVQNEKPAFPGVY